MKISTKIAIAILALGALCIPGAPSASGAEAPPYAVTPDGVTLTDGGTFPAHGHVNWQTNLRSGGTHFDPNNGQPGGAFIGQTFFPIALQPGECITWVQYSETGYHYGENGEPPVCAPATTPTPEPTSPSTPETPAPSPSSTAPPTEPSPSPMPEVSPSPTPTESTPSLPTPTPTTTTSPQPTAEVTPEPSATTPALGAQPPAADAPNIERLAATGGMSPAGAAAVIAIILLALGTAIGVALHRRQR